MTKPPTTNKDLAEPVHVRLPVEVMKQIEAESERDGIPVSALVRRAVIREYRVDGGVRNIDTTSGNSSSMDRESA